jgi:Zn-dependent protease
MSFLNNLAQYLYIIPAILLAVSGHELSHGYVAYRLGDPTPKTSGRLTLNPLAHLDPLGTISLIIFRFGWAKPVEVNPFYFKNRKRDMALVALAGPMSNFLMAFIAAFLLAVCIKLSLSGPAMDVAITFLNFLVIINIGLGLFNLIPCPPLDGSKILGAVLPDATYFRMMRYDMYFQIGLIFLLYLGFLTRPLSLARNVVLMGIYQTVSFLVGV